ncbi:radical SAM/SPASM protein FxsBH, inactivated beta-hydroxylase extension form [Streptomyces sp. NRRL S-1314]|uniref:radical SAM/SPASM protein FxsBH, inactivated beta-hydroxylase extension form n=1 Tax=Streptomyces sp. NRRL S-1314 TaxID=1463882 RepID=UPI0004C5D9FC|nr:radical SAM/SPASM protein FxsB, inactivated metallohydrolase extension form [Streptomyces sp. NRRL S-1314]
MKAPAGAPLRQLVLKIHSRCDLACDHCYVYEHADRSWQARPKVMAEETAARTARRLADYARSHELDSVSVILHGGEPLLAGPARIRAICAELRATVGAVTDLDLAVHTNGVQLSRRHLDVFKEFDVRVGISLDGDRVANDRHRLDRRGRSSYDRVLRAVALLRTPEYRHLFGGLLCTVDVDNDPLAVHEALTELDPPRIDYLLPHSTWDTPPPRGSSGSPTPYADWLLAVFDRWLEQGRKVPVRTFDSVLSTLRGGPSLTEAMGLAPTDLAVVETDGAFEQADSLKVAYDGAPATGYDVFRHGFDAFVRHPGVRARRLGIAGVSETCRRCPVVQSCGGGLYAHRYSSERLFDNPSVFCADLRALVDGIAERITERAYFPGLTDPGELRLALLERDRELLAHLNDRLAGDADWDETWQSLLHLDADERTAAHLDRVLAHSHVRASLAQAPVGVELTARVASVAVAAAVQARSSLRLSWLHDGGVLHLPTLGTLNLPSPARIQAEVDGARLTVTLPDGHRIEVKGDAPAPGWRPSVHVDMPGGEQVLVDDTDPWRDRFHAEVAEPLELSALAAFAEQLRTAHRTLSEQDPGWADGPNALRADTVTPLAPGTGVRLDTDGTGALGVALDATSADIADALPRLGRLARLANLRRATDLHVPGTRAGSLLTDAVEALAQGDRARAECALEELAGPAAPDLTETGAALVEELRAEAGPARG